MTKEEQNQIIKNAWVKQLSTDKKIPEDIANTYSLWVQQKIKDTQAQMQQPAEQAPQEQQPAQEGQAIMEADNGVQTAQ